MIWRCTHKEFAMPYHRLCHVFVALTTLLCLEEPGFAAPSGTSPNTAASPEDAEARAHFKAGSEHFENGDYREAYDEFRKTMALKKTRAVMGFAASSLRQMGRYDEALDLYEEIVRDYPNLPPDFKTKVDTAIADLTKLVGTLSAAGDAPAGAELFVDDRPRGKLPLAAPIRVAQGLHAIRVQKEGFDPITASVEIAPEKTNTVTLVAKSRQGRLVLNEKHNWPLVIEIDGKEVGTTPWQGFVEPGEHRVRLHGYMSLEALAECAPPEAGVLARAGAKMETPEQTVTIQSFESTTLTLGADDVDASLRIESTPNGASLRIDSRAMGKTPWEGRLPLGVHTIEVNANGFIMAKQTVRLERRKEREVSVLLEREPNLAGQRLARNVTTGIGFGVGAVGLGIFAISGGLAKGRVDDIRSRCGGVECPAAEAPNVSAARALGTMSTVGLVVAGFGMAAGTVGLVLLQPKVAEKRTNVLVGTTLNLGFGVQGLSLKGDF